MKPAIGVVAIISVRLRRQGLHIIDGECLRNPEHPILVLDLMDEPGRTFRVVPSELWSVENNLSLANMDFSDFADTAGADHIFRGFPDG